MSNISTAGQGRLVPCYTVASSPPPSQTLWEKIIEKPIHLIAAIVTIVVGIIAIYSFFVIDSTFPFSVVVQDKAGQEIPGVEVIIDLHGPPTLSSITDNTGLATFKIPSDYRTQSGEIRINEEVYFPYHRKIMFQEQAASHKVLLEPR